MVRLLSIISLILAIVLFPPAALALISNNAVPGDATYPIKRTLEDVIFAVASIHPTSKAWFAAARSDRRFKEFTTLVTQGKKTGDALNELVEQTQVAASQIAQVKDESQKQKLVLKLSESIKKYDQGLQQVSSPTTPLPQATPAPAPDGAGPVPQETASPTATVLPSPTPTSASIIQPTPRPSLSPSPHPTQTPTPTVQPTPRPDREEEERERQRQREIEEARRRLEEIRSRLERQQRRQNEGEHRSFSEEDRQQIRQENEANFLLRNREESKQEKQKEEKREGKDKKGSKE